MTIAINWLAVVLATVVSIILSMVWCSAWGLFGSTWNKLTGVTSAKLKKALGKKPMVVLLVTNFVTTLTLTVAIADAAAYFNDRSVWLALSTGFVLWLGLSATTLLQHNTFEMKSSKLTLINNGYQLVMYLGIALIVGLLGA